MVTPLVEFCTICGNAAQWLFGPEVQAVAARV